MQFFGSKNEKIMFGRGITVRELKNIEDLIRQRCDRDSIGFPPKVEYELSRRIKEASKSSTKAKLAFNNSGLDDKHLIYLIEALATSPVLIKLDIRDNNITDKGIGYILRLLRGQVKLVKTVPADKRSTANFLSNIDVGDPTDGVSVRSIEEIRRYTDVLAFCNAATTVLKCYMEMGQPDVLDIGTLQNLWKEIVGKPLTKQSAEELCAVLSPESPSHLTYAQAEMAILRELIESGCVPELTDGQLDMFKTAEDIAVLRTPLLTSLTSSSKISRSDSFGSNSSGNSRLGSGQLLRGLSMRFSPMKSPKRSLESAGGDSGLIAADDDGGGDDTKAAPATGFSGQDSVGMTDKERVKDYDMRHLVSCESLEDDSVLLEVISQSGGTENKEIHMALFKLLAGNKKTVTLSEFTGAVQSHRALAQVLNLPSQISAEDGSRSRCLRLFSSIDEECTGSISFDNFSDYIRANYNPPPATAACAATERTISPVITAAGGAELLDEVEGDVLDDDDSGDASGSDGAGYTPNVSGMSNMSGGTSSDDDTEVANKGMTASDGNGDSFAPTVATDTSGGVSRVNSIERGAPVEDFDIATNDGTAAGSAAVSGGDENESSTYDDSFQADKRNELPIPPSPPVKVTFATCPSMRSPTPEKMQSGQALSRPPPILAQSYTPEKLRRRQPLKESPAGPSPAQSDYIMEDDESGIVDDESSSPADLTSSYSKGQMVIKCRALEEIEVPADVMSMLYTQTGNKRRRSRPGLHNVKRLVFSHNNVVTLQAAQLTQFSYLLHLDLSFNSIEKIEGEFPPQLEVLKLKRNNISALSGLLLCTSMRVLDLSHNKIRHIDGLPISLESLDLDYNFIAGEMNLRILSLCQEITSISIEGNPVMGRLQKNCKARLLSLLPKLREVNHTALPRARKQAKEPEPVPLPHESFVWPDSPRHKGRQSRSTSANRRSSSSSRSPVSSRRKRLTRQAQQKIDERLYKEAEVQRKARERQLQLVSQSFQDMSKTMLTRHKVSPKSQQELEEIGRKLFSWRPCHIKQMEEEAKKREIERIAAASHSREEQQKKREELKQLRKQRYKEMKLRFSSNGGFKGSYSQQHQQSMVHISAEEVELWTGLMQTKLSAAYELVCGLFDDVQVLHAELKGSAVEGLMRPQDVIDRYIGHIDRLYFELCSMQTPSGHMPVDVVEDVTGWQEDSQLCCSVLTTLKEVLFLLSPGDTQSEGGDNDSAVESLLVPVGSILSSLQMSNDGVPLDLVSWAAGVARSEAVLQAVRIKKRESAMVRQPRGLSPTGKGVPPFSPIRPAGAPGGGYVEGQLDITEIGDKFSIIELEGSRLSAVPNSTTQPAEVAAAIPTEIAESLIHKNESAQAVQDRMQRLRNRLLLKTGLSAEPRPGPASSPDPNVSSPLDSPRTLASDYMAATVAQGVDVCRTDTYTGNPPSVPIPHVAEKLSQDTVTGITSSNKPITGAVETESQTVVPRVQKELSMISTVSSYDGDDNESDNSVPSDQDGIEDRNMLVARTVNDVEFQENACSQESDATAGKESGSASIADNILCSPEIMGDSAEAEAEAVVQDRKDTKPVENDANIDGPEVPVSVATNSAPPPTSGPQPSTTQRPPVPHKPVLLALMEAHDRNDLNESISSPIRDSSSLTKEMILARKVSSATTPHTALGGLCVDPPVAQRQRQDPNMTPIIDREDDVGETRGSNVSNDIATDDISAQSIFQRMGNLKQRMMMVGAPPTPPATAPKDSLAPVTVRHAMSNMSDISDISDIESAPGSEITQGSSAMERLRAKLAANKREKSNYI